MARRGRGGLREGRNAEPVASSLYTTPAVAPSPRVLAVNTPGIDFGNFQITPEMLANIQAGIPQPAPAPTVDPSLYSDPGLGAPIPLNVGIGGEGGGQPMPQVPMPAPKPIPQPAPAPYADPAPVPQPRPQPIPQPVPQPIPAPAPPPPPPPPPVEVAPPPPPIPQISPEVLAQIQQEFNIPAAPVAPPPPVQVPPPVVQPEGIATLPQAPVEPPPAPVAQEFSLPPRRISEPVSQPEPLAGPGMPTPSGGFLPGIDLNNLDLSGLAVPNQVQPAPEAVAPPPVVQPAPEPAPAPVFGNIERPFDPSLFSDPELGGGPRGEPLPDTRGGDPTGIETMAESVGQGDYLGIPLPDGGTFDLNTLDLSSIGGEGGMGNVDPSLYSDPGLGGGVGPGFDPYAGVTGGLGPGGYGPEGGGFTPPYNTEPGFDPVEDVMQLPLYDENGNIVEPAFNRGDIGFGPVGVEGGYSYDGNGNIVGEPVFNPPQGAIDEAQGTTYTENNFTPDLSGLDLDFSNLDLSGLDLGNLNIGGEGGAGNNSYNPEDQGGPQGGPGMGNGPGFTMGGTDASGNGNGPGFGDNSGNADDAGSGNPYPFIPGGVDTSQMTPEQLTGLNNFYEMYPDGFDYNGLDLSGIGNIDLSGIPGGTGTDDGSYTVDPVDPVGDLGVGDDAGSDPIDVTTPYVPPETRAASSYGLTGAVQTMPVAANPFRRPEAQQGIGSLAGGG